MACIGVDPPALIAAAASAFQPLNAGCLGEEPMAAPVVQQGLHGRQRIDLAVLRREQGSGGGSRQGRCELPQRIPAEEPQRQALLLALFSQPRLGEPLLLVAGQLQQASSPRDPMTPLLQQLTPVLPERQGLLPQPPTPAAAAPEDLCHQ
jgi:hypothetical protein